MRLHVVCRSVGTENSKGRPDFYSKAVCLGSLLRAVEGVDLPTDVVFVNDGPVPAERLQFMEAAGEVLPVSCGSNRSSYRRVLRLARERGWPAEDLVWFAEDDYLYRADALASVVEAARARRSADYFAVYSSLRFGSRARRFSPVFRSAAPAGAGGGCLTAGAVSWVRAVSTTSTFGVRVGVLLADERLLRAAPFVGGAWDHATCLAVQGYRPFAVRELAGDAREAGQETATKAAVRRAALAVARSTLDVAALARPSRARRTLIASEPDLATHVELGVLAPGRDWAAEAPVVERWMARRMY